MPLEGIRLAPAGIGPIQSGVAKGLGDNFEIINRRVVLIITCVDSIIVRDAFRFLAHVSFSGGKHAMLVSSQL